MRWARAAEFQHTALVTEEGVEILTGRTAPAGDPPATESAADRWERVLRERTVVVSGPIDDAAVTETVTGLLRLAGDDPGSDITVSIDSPGGSVSAGLAVYDVVQWVECDIRTVCRGDAGGLAAVLLAGGTPGKRLAVPSARIVLTPLTVEPASRRETESRQFAWMRRSLEQILVGHTGRSPGQVRLDVERGRTMTAEQAKRHGLIDGIVDGDQTRPPG